MKNYLLIDTSSTKAQIGIANEEGIIDKKVWDSYQNLSEKLLPNIDNMLGKNRMAHKDLDGIMVYLGPGTFTGLRIGITVANSFAYSLGIGIAGVKGKGFGKDKFEIRELEPTNMEELYKKGKDRFKKGQTEKIVTPFYGKKPNVG